MKDQSKTPPAGQTPVAHDVNPSHLPEGVAPAKPVQPRKGFDPAAIKGKGGKGFGPIGKRMVIPGKGRSR